MLYITRPSQITLSSAFALSLLMASAQASYDPANEALYETKTSSSGWYASLQSRIKASTTLTGKWSDQAMKSKGSNVESYLQELTSFEEQIESLKESPLRAPAMANYLRELQTLVWDKTISPDLYLKSLEELSISLPHYQKTFTKVTSQFKATLKQRAKAQQRMYEDQAFILTALQTLPYYNQEIDPIYTTVTKGASYKGALKGIAHAAYKGMDFILKNPRKAFTLGLAGQVAASAAMNSARAISNEFMINQLTTGNQAGPSVASLSNGNIFVTWTGDPTGMSDIYGRIFSPNGTALTDEFTINQLTTGNQERASVASLSNNNVFVTWMSDPAGTYVYDIYGRVLSPNGTALTDEFTVNQVTTGRQFNPSVASLTDGNAFVAWESNPTGLDSDVYGRVFSGNGTALTDDFTINQVTTGTQVIPSVTSLTDGNAFVAWESNPTEADSNIAGRIFSTNGTALTNEMALNQLMAGDQLFVSVAALNSGNVFAAWESRVSGTDNIIGRVFSANGAALTDDFTINQVTTGSQSNPSVASLADGSVCVAWSSNPTGTRNIYGRFFFANGTALTNEFTVNQVMTNSQSNPSAAGLLNSNVFVAWDSTPINPTSYDIYGRIFDSSIPSISTTTTNAITTTMNPTTQDSTTVSSSTGSSSPSSTSLSNAATSQQGSTTNSGSTGSSSPSSTSLSNTASSHQGSMTSKDTGAVSSAHNLKPNWLLLPLKGITSGIQSLWGMIKNVE